MSFDSLQTACLNGEDLPEPKPASLYDIVKEWPGVLPQAKFIDAVAFNLQRGRILVIAAGDGIRQETHTLSNLLQSLTSAQFTFALVELAVYQREDDFIICPNTLLKTETITRTVVVSSGTGLTASATSTRINPHSPNQQKSKTISELDFMEAIGTAIPGVEAPLQAFIDRLATIGIYTEFKGAMNFKHERPGAKNPINLGYLKKNGRFFSSPAGWWDLSKIGQQYHAQLAKIIGGTVKASAKLDNRYATTDGKRAPKIDRLLEAEDEVFKLMRAYLKAVLVFDEAKADK
jgi:hypothetical protein